MERGEGGVEIECLLLRQASQGCPSHKFAQDTDGLLRDDKSNVTDLIP